MKKALLAITTSLLFTSGLFAQAKPEDTEYYTPVPPIVKPGSGPFDAPADAIILFDGKNIGEWVMSNDTTAKAKWIVDNGMMTVDKKTGDIQTKRRFTDFQLHIEYRIPENITGTGQARGNSGIFLAAFPGNAGGYELQVLDNYNNTTYVNGQAGSIYKQSPPLVNACKKPGEWQTYSVIWTAPRFNDDGSVKSPGRITALHNGVLVQNNYELKGDTPYIGKPAYKKHGAAPIKLQSHGDKSEPISFRNIWLRVL
ncbi:DUF1080 domain-containing protein [Segetibacter sp. 3557_3]|uniref:3-keto-disaccharide hydrolase n=1 Tax=Segetibacter sp. 3557_3 TaxID=2547429 RepID=UPI00105882FA|nr:DUF1080 domain-containing protein [Segetibacter sp. 3557_3]TDH27435.1 DUF1080 domain-containing protein [Segetibacter sp. 3557_3]